MGLERGMQDGPLRLYKVLVGNPSATAMMSWLYQLTQCLPLQWNKLHPGHGDHGPGEQEVG